MFAVSKEGPKNKKKEKEAAAKRPAPAQMDWAEFA
jgi:hypothetical protein